MNSDLPEDLLWLRSGRSSWRLPGLQRARSPGGSHSRISSHAAKIKKPCRAQLLCCWQSFPPGREPHNAALLWARASIAPAIPSLDGGLHLHFWDAHPSFWDHRIIGPLRSSSATINPSPPCLLNHVQKCHIYMFFEHLQGWGLHHCPGQPGPVPDHSFSEDIFPNIQSEPPLTQLEAISSHSIAGYLGDGHPSCQTSCFRAPLLAQHSWALG